VTQDMAEGRSAGVTGTPAFFVNGVLISGARPQEDFFALIDAELGRN
ncbi:MAG: DsbA family protein, partial [Myxococcota bacterium]